MGTELLVDNGTRGDTFRVLPGVGRKSSDPQQTPRGPLHVTTENPGVNSGERLYRMEEKLNIATSSLSRTIDRLDAVSDRLETVARLEERWQSHDMRLADLSTAMKTENERRTRIDEAIFDRIRVLENSSGLNSHGRDMQERLAVPAVSATVGGILVYSVKLIWSS